MNDIAQMIVLRNGMFMIFAIICIILFLVSCFIIGRIHILKKKKEDIHFPALKIQKERLPEYDPNKENCYIHHELLDEENIVLAFSIPLTYKKIKMLRNLSRRYNVILINRNIMDDDVSYNLIHCIEYIRANNLPICRICDYHNKQLVYRAYEIIKDKKKKRVGSYWVEVKHV